VALDDEVGLKFSVGGGFAPVSASAVLMGLLEEVG
jgi:hypothetical protein